MSHEHAIETIRMFGDHVIPKLDTDPVHRSTRFREAAGGPLELKGPQGPKGS
jgi:hypothetical protein